MRDVLDIVVPWTITTAFLFACLGYDERRLRGTFADRAWPPATRLSAVLGFGIFAMPIHCARTGRSRLRRLVGILFSIAALAIEFVVDTVLDALPPIHLGPEGPRTTAIAAAMELALFYASYRIIRRASATAP
jgi:hypothetical protein